MMASLHSKHLFGRATERAAQQAAVFYGRVLQEEVSGQLANALEEYNRTLFSPPLPSTEVMTVIKQHEKKDWGYTCKDEPFKSYCDPSLCVLAKHGISDDAPDAPQVGG